MGAQLEDAFSDRQAALIEQAIQQNGNHIEFWQQYCQLTPPTLAQAGRVGEVMTALRENARALLRAKAAAPLDAVPPGADFTKALQDYETLRAAIAGYNAAVGPQTQSSPPKSVKRRSPSFGLSRDNWPNYTPRRRGTRTRLWRNARSRARFRQKSAALKRKRSVKPRSMSTPSRSFVNMVTASTAT